MDELTKDLNKSERISFPVTFELKVILDATIPDETNTRNIEALLDELSIPNEFIRKRLSSSGRYMSFSYKVSFEDHKSMKDLYEKLKELPGIKFAI